MKKASLIMIIFSLALAILISSCSKSAQYSNLDSFSKCLTDSGVKFYGAFWCPHCTNQKNMFGKSFENIDSTECSLPDKSGQTQVCKDAKILKYPTWEFKDGSRMQGELTLAQLSQKSGCSLS